MHETLKEPARNSRGLSTPTNDISERKRAEEALGKEEALLKAGALQRAIFNSANFSSIATDAKGVIQIFNVGAERMLGYTAAEVMNKITPADMSDPQELVARATALSLEFATTIAPGFEALVFKAARGIEDIYELTKVRKDGSRFPAVVSVTALRDAQDAIIGYLLIVTDNTARKHAEEALLKAGALQRAIFNSANFSSIATDANGVIQIFNVGAERMLGYTAAEVMNKITPADISDPQEVIARAEALSLELGTPITPGFEALVFKASRGIEDIYKLTYIRKDGSRFPAVVSVTALRDVKDAVIGYLLIGTDNTAHKSAESELLNAKAAAEAANRAKSDFLANMSHEIRTPITAIIGFAELLLRPDQSAADRADYINIVRRNAKNLLDIINDILDLSKIEAGKMTVEKMECNVPKLMADILSTTRLRAKEKALKFGINFIGKIPQNIQTDRVKFRQILVNLLGNAVKFTEKGSVEMDVRFETVGGCNVLHVDVRDSGIGLTAEQSDQLFQPFTQADKSTTRRFGGTGLGLTISRQLARLLGGEVEVKSVPGIGSTFTMTIDCGPSSGLEMLEGLSESGLPVNVLPLNNSAIVLHGRILLAEDGRDNQRLLTTHLKAAGADMTIAENGQIAVEMAMSRPFDLILMDMQMPEMDGYTATAELRRRGITLPIIALTAHAMSEDRTKCLESGCSDYLSKPVTQETILRTVAHHLGQTIAPLLPQNEQAEESATVDPGGTICSTMSDYPGMKTIIDEFVEGLPEEIAKLQNLIESEDLLPLRRVAHQLRGAGGGYGFDAITEFAGKVEDSINAADNRESISEQIHSLIDVIRRVEGFDPGSGDSTELVEVRRRHYIKEVENVQTSSHHR